MQKSYLLLRHNQQSGPYSLEELTRMSLQAKDLIWVIGQSAGWRYPEEVDALRPYVQGSREAAATATHQPAQPSTEKKPQAADPNARPARHIYVSLPTSAAPTAITTSNTPEASSLSFEERVEKMRQRVAAVDSANETAEEPEVETKYSRSLEDIKTEYASWMQTQKRNRKRGVGSKQVSVVAVILVAAVGVFSIIKPYFSQPADKAVVKKASVPARENFYPTVVMPPAPVTSKKAAIRKVRKVTTDESIASGKKVETKKNVVPQQEAQPDSPVTMPEAAPLAMADTASKAAIQEATAATPEKPATVAEQLHVNAEYIAGSKRSSGVDGLAVTVKNNSKQVMKVVAVDVIYFKDGLAELERKTLYFSNLRPGQVLTQHAPAHKKAEGAYAQLGLISSEEGGLFYASNQ